MRPYLKKMSYRPGCVCCNINKGLHHHRPAKKSQEDKNARRAGKKQARQQGKKMTLLVLDN